MDQLRDEQIVIKKTIYDGLGNIYIAKNTLVKLNTVNINRFKRIGIWEEIIANRKLNICKNEQSIENKVGPLIKAYKEKGQGEFGNAMKYIQKIIFGERIFKRYPHLGMLLEHAESCYTHSINVAILSVLLAQSNLTIQEMEIKQKHCSLGIMAMKSINIPLKSQKIIEQHHEKLDGTGYPNSLKEIEILEEARLVAVADTLDTKSSYRGGGEISDIEEIIQEMYNLPEKYARKHTEVLKKFFEV